MDSYKDTEHSPAIHLEILAHVIIASQVYKLRKCVIGNCTCTFISIDR